MTNNEIEQIGLQLWQYLSGCIGGVINTPVNYADLTTFQTGNYYSKEQVMQALSWCIEQGYFTKEINEDGDVCTMLIKAYE